MGVGTGFAALNGHTPTSVPTGQVGREIQIEEVFPERRTVRGLGGGAGTDSQDLLRVRPVKREFGLEYLGVGVRLHTLADGRGRIVHPYPTAHSEVRCWTQRVGEGGAPAVNTGNGEGMVCADNVVRAFAGRWSSRNRPGGRGLDSGVPRHQCDRKPSGGAMGVNSCGPRWAPDPSPRYGIVASEFDVAQMQVPIVLSLVNDHSQHLGHSVFTRSAPPLQLG